MLEEYVMNFWYSKSFWKESEWVRGVDPLALTHRYTAYEVGLERCQNAQEVLRWLSHISDKSWCTSKTLGDLCHALDLILNFRGDTLGNNP